VPSLLVVPESFAPEDIALAFDRRKVSTSTVYPFYPGFKAPTVMSMLDHDIISSMYFLSDGATFLETGLPPNILLLSA